MMTSDYLCLDGMSRSQLYLMDEFKDLEFWIRDEVEYA